MIKEEPTLVVYFYGVIMRQIELGDSQTEDHQTVLSNILLQAGANSDMQMDPATALLWALNRGDAQTVRALVQVGVSIPTQNKWMQEKILQAVQKGFCYSASFS